MSHDNVLPTHGGFQERPAPLAGVAGDLAAQLATVTAERDKARARADRVEMMARASGLPSPDPIDRPAFFSTLISYAALLTPGERISMWREWAEWTAYERDESVKRGNPSEGGKVAP